MRHLFTPSYLVAVIFLILAGVTAAADLELAVDEVLEGQIGDMQGGVVDKIRAYNPTSLYLGGLEFEVFVQSNFDQLRRSDVRIVGDTMEVLQVDELLNDDRKTGCTLPEGSTDISKFGGPDYLTVAGEKLLVSAYGNSDILKGRIQLSYTQGGQWTFQHLNGGPKFLLYPLCDQDTSDPTTFDDTLCDKIGASGTAIIEVGSYYYIYFDISREGHFPHHGIFLMRVHTQSTPPYVRFSAGDAEMWHAGQQTWYPLPFDPTWGYYMSVCGDPICQPGVDPVWCKSPFGGSGGFTSWSLPGYANPGKLGDVSMAADGSYILSYAKWLVPTNDRRNGQLVYKNSFDPTFAGAAEHVVDTTRLVAAIDPDMQRLKSSFFYLGDYGIEYLMFFTHEPLDSVPFHRNSVKVATVRTKAPEIRVVQGVVDQQPDTLPGSTYSGFPVVDPGEPTSKAWQIWNTGLLSDLLIGAGEVEVTGEGFHLIEDPAPATVEPYEGNTSRFGQFRVRLHSATSGTKIGQVQITHNGPENNPFVFNLLGQVSSPTEVTLASDSFTTSINQNLNGRGTETGGQTWAGNFNALVRRVGTNNGYVTGNTGGNLIGTIPYSHNGSRVAIVEGKIRPQGSTYAAIGFTINTNSGWFATGIGQVWVRVFPSGLYQVCSNGASNCLGGNAPISNFLGANQLNSVKLRYNPSGRKVDLWINGVQELNGATLPGTFVPTLVRAGAYVASATVSETRIDDFVLKEEQ